MEIHDIILIVTAAFGLLGTLIGGGGLAAYLRIRGENVKILAEVEQIRAQASKLDADTIKTLAEAEETKAKAWDTLTKGQSCRLDQMNKAISDQEQRIAGLVEQLRQRDLESERRDERIEDLVAKVKEQDLEIARKQFTITQQAERIDALVEEVDRQQAEIAALRNELEEWKTGKRGKPKTGPLKLKGAYDPA